jgi:hypothetical protein
LFQLTFLFSFLYSSLFLTFSFSYSPLPSLLFLFFILLPRLSSFSFFLLPLFFQLLFGYFYFCSLLRFWIPFVLPLPLIFFRLPSFFCHSLLFFFSAECWG